MSSFSSVTLFKVPFFPGTLEEVVARVERAITQQTSRRSLLIFTPNTEQLELARSNEQFFQALLSSDLNLPDSSGVVWAGKQLQIARFPRKTIPGRIFVGHLLNLLAKHKRKVFLLGGRSGVGERAAEVIRSRYAGIQVGWSSGAQDVAHASDQDHAQTMSEIQKFNPDVLLVAYGAPHQELWAVQHREMLEKAGVKVVMVVGGTLDLLAGRLRPAPNAVRTLGFEWLWRLIQQPSRLKRQLALPRFVIRVLMAK